MIRCIADQVNQGVLDGQEDGFDAWEHGVDAWEQGLDAQSLELMRAAWL